MIKELNWDSKFFGFKIGRYSGKLPTGKDEEEFIKEFRRKKYDCVYIFCDEKDSICAETDKKKFLLPVGGHAEYELTKENWQRKEWSRQDIHVFKFSEKTIKGAHKIAADIKILAGKLVPISRFYYDLRFRSRARKMYEIWADKIIKEKNGLMVINLKNNRVAGLVGYEFDKNIGRVSLVKTKKEFEGQGIASGLLDYAIEKLFAKGVKKIIVITRTDNEAAKNLYQNAGFKINKLTRIYHCWRNKL